jgi:predicted nucleic acid-binding protein
MVAALCAWHEHHERAAAELNRRLRRERMLLAAPALVETYAVLTRLPPPHRLSPTDALNLVEATFLDGGQIIALDGAAYRALLRRAPQGGIAGGRIYDVVIAHCALKAKAAAPADIQRSALRVVRACRARNRRALLEARPSCPPAQRRPRLPSIASRRARTTGFVYRAADRHRIAAPSALNMVARLIVQRRWRVATLSLDTACSRGVKAVGGISV